MMSFIRMSRFCLISPPLALFLTGCVKSEPNRTSAPSGPILAQVGKETVSPSEFEQYLKNLVPASRALAKTPDGRRQLLQGLLHQKSIAALSREAGIDKDPEFQQLIKNYEEGQLSRLYIQKLKSESQVPEAQIQSYYKAHPEEFTEGTVQASHIVTATYEDALKAQKLLQQKKSFADVAKALSTDRTSAAKGGRIAPISTLNNNSNQIRILRVMPKGEVSGILPTSGGYEILKKEGVVTGKLKPLSEVSNEIRDHLQNQAVYTRLNEAKTKLPVKIDEKLLSEISVPQ
jgi:peptidyl-prolyl cis-trans isomerase C